jgi:hypothetical protein
VVAAMSSTIAVRLVSGRPRQFCVMWQNRRCSILFHFEVPGGQCRQLFPLDWRGGVPGQCVRRYHRDLAAFCVERRQLQG